jgi:hypothetical protein
VGCIVAVLVLKTVTRVVEVVMHASPCAVAVAVTTAVEVLTLELSMVGVWRLGVVATLLGSGVAEAEDGGSESWQSSPPRQGFQSQVQPCGPG